MKLDLQKGLLIVCLIICAATLLLVFQMTRDVTRIAYVRNYDLVYQYDGMKEAQIEFGEMKTQMQFTLDSLKMGFQKTLGEYQSRLSELQEMERRTYIALLGSMEDNIDNYQELVNRKIGEHDEKISGQLLGQINSLVERYGKENGYDVILGTTENGNLLYCQESMDITNEILDYLNNNYQGIE